MRTKIITFIILSVFLGCNGKKTNSDNNPSTQRAKTVTPDDIEQSIAEGNFNHAEILIDLYISENEFDKKTADSLRFEKEILERIRKDFSANKDEIIKYIRKYYPDANDEMLDRWEESRALEVRPIEGKKKYFKEAAPNLFRIDKEAKAQKEKINGTHKDGLQKFLERHLTEVIAQSKSSKARQSKPVGMKVTYTVTVDKDVIQTGNNIRCWLPYPRTDNRRQTDIRITAASADDILIAPEKYQHSTIYLEKPQLKDKETVFSITFYMTSAGEWFDLKPEDIKPYNTSSELYRKYTAQRTTHVIFNDKIKELSKKIIGDETNPLLISNKILDYIRENYPWASALEYSTMHNIPEYVIDNRHGDCGMVSLLYITLCRYNGIPAKWQSGFMMHPGAAGLHDWAEVYFEGVGWVPVDPSFYRRRFDNPELDSFYAHGIDAYRWIVNDDYSCELYPFKKFPRSETVDFQRGEVETYDRNLYFDKWRWNIKVDVL